MVRANVSISARAAQSPCAHSDPGMMAIHPAKAAAPAFRQNIIPQIPCSNMSDHARAFATDQAICRDATLVHRTR
jgi:hypothetical protein